MSKSQVEELWEKIPGYQNYLVSNYGEVINNDTGFEVRQSVATNGYSKVKLSKHGVTTTRYVHRLVGAAFLIDYDPTLQLLHKEEPKSDNSVLNLRVGEKKIGKTVV